MSRESDLHSDDRCPAITLRPGDVSEHAAVRWGRRVLQDPRLDAWPRDDRRPPDGLPPELAQAVADARGSLLAVAPAGTTTDERAPWMRAPRREVPDAMFLMVGDDVAIVLARTSGARWTAITVLVKQHADSPYTYERRRERRRRQRARRHPPTQRTPAPQDEWRRRRRGGVGRPWLPAVNDGGGDPRWD